MKALLLALLAALALSACERPGDFCDVYMSTAFDDPAVALQVVQLDRLAAESMAVNEDSYSRCP